MKDYKIEIDSSPFSWNDKMADLAIEDFESLRADLPYCQCQSIGLALAKLKMIEEGELIINPKRKVDNDLISRKALLEEVEKSLNFNPHENPAISLNHRHEHIHFINMIKKAPVSYDVDKVCDELKNATGSIHYTEDASFDGKCIEDFEFIQSKTAIEIVRNGGK